MAKTLLTPSNLKAVRFNLEGVADMVAKLNRLGKNIEPIFEKAIKEITEGVRADIKDWAQQHIYTGAVYESVNSSDVMRDGNSLYAMVGIDGRINYDSWHAVFVEYGTPFIPADPGIRRAFDKWRRKAPAIYKKHLEEALCELS